ncbi:DegT/DnrJ/EryC1/StrS family aminotransferase [Metabacillus halosaccharovorans]|uniref:DegT/DnrJ/EryC1/StrS family aminotransferase n=1 Tax=Metabacillus halosaccharovorans TaxID=930124 RepID=UPI001C20002A|nr:DegT/DnrJ/EryC1/StrS family aminotransferase [Metabacillus halosaccharovorans]MBU7592276.1 DegT/DnrJ/EryC1/StrS family aminotransferase [Metabacillus halosaccharovorans]
MKIPLSKPDITDKEKHYVQEVMESGQLSLGEKTELFEKQFIEHFRAKYAVAMNSGTSALHVAVKTLGLKTGDEVITTPYSFIASGNCLVYEGVKPVFVDIDPLTLNIDTTKIEQAITPRTKAILAVHIFGQPCNMDHIMEISKRFNLYVIEDACEAIGATWNGYPVGLLGNAGVFAFYPNKQITTGEGGVLVTNEKSIYEMASALRNQGRSLKSEWLDHKYIGYNYRMSELQAAVGLGQMERLNQILMKREEVAIRYKKLIDKYKIPVSTPKILPNCKVSWFVFIIILPKHVRRDRVINHLSHNGIQSKPYFPSIHLQPSFKNYFGFQVGQFPVCEMMSESTLAIPFFNNITLEEQTHIIETLKSCL